MKKKLMVAALAATLMVPGQVEAVGRGFFKRTTPLLRRVLPVLESIESRSEKWKLLSDRDFTFNSWDFNKESCDRNSTFLSKKLNEMNYSFHFKDNINSSVCFNSPLLFQQRVIQFANTLKRFAIQNRFRDELRNLSDVQLGKEDSDRMKNLLRYSARNIDYFGFNASDFGEDGDGRMAFVCQELNSLLANIDKSNSTEFVIKFFEEFMQSLKTFCVENRRVRDLLLLERYRLAITSIGKESEENKEGIKQRGIFSRLRNFLNNYVFRKNEKKQSDKNEDKQSGASNSDEESGNNSSAQSLNYFLPCTVMLKCPNVLDRKRYKHSKYCGCGRIVS